MFRIIKKDEPIVINNVNILIYGEPGAGKTSLANTSLNCLTLDFDKGVHRSEFRKDVLVIENWEQFNDNIQEFIKTLDDYDTVIFDTVDTLLDYMGAWIIKREPKLAKIKLQFFGVLKDEFSRFVGILKTLGKDIVMIAHVKEKEEGDTRIKRPAITGGSYDRVLQSADFAGFVFVKDNKRMVDFNPTDYWIGKNSAKFKQMVIPDFNKIPDFFAGLINDMKAAINQESQSQAETVQLINNISARIQEMETATELSSLFVECTNLRNGIKKQVWEKIQIRAKELDYEYDSANKAFVKIKSVIPKPVPDLSGPTKKPVGIIDSAEQARVDFANKKINEHLANTLPEPPITVHPKPVKSDFENLVAPISFD